MADYDKHLDDFITRSVEKAIEDQEAKNAKQEMGRRYESPFDFPHLQNPPAPPDIKQAIREIIDKIIEDVEGSPLPGHSNPPPPPPKQEIPLDDDIGSVYTFENPQTVRVMDLYGQQYEDSIEYMRICTRLFSELKMVEVSGGLPAEAVARIAKEFENFKKVILKEQKI